MKKLLVSHVDTDGCGPVIIAEAYDLGFDKIIMFNYGDVDTEESIELYMQYDQIVFADLSCTENTYRILVQAGKQVRILDHHKSSDWCKQYEGNVHDLNRCGTRIFYEEYVVDQSHRNSVADTLVRLIDVYDRWLLDDPNRAEAENLNRLKYAYMEGKSRTSKADKYPDNREFIEAQVDKIIYDVELLWHTRERDMVDASQKKEQDAIKKGLDIASVRTDNEGETFAILSDVGYVSQVAAAILQSDKNITYCIVGYPDKGVLSVRSQDHFDVTELEGINGHKNAGGGSFDKSFVEELLLNDDYSLGRK